MRKQEKSEDKFPKIYRFIFEPLKKHKSKLTRQKVFRVYKKTLKIFTVFIFIIAIIYLGFDLYRNTQEKKRIDFEREKISKELDFWKSFIAEHNDYRDAYFQASILEYKLGNTDLSKLYLSQGLAVDPNSENGKKIEDFINK